MAYEGVLLRIFIGEADRVPGRDRSRLHAANLLERSTGLPILVEIVDPEERIKAFPPTVDELVTEGLVTLEAVRVLEYAAGARRS